MPPPDRQHSTRLLRAASAGDVAATDALLPLVYDELHAIAQRLLRRAGPAPTLQPTELIHEAYVRLVDDQGGAWEGEQHFRRVAARAMRFVLVDRARARHADKRGAGRRQVTLETQWAEVVDDADHVLTVHEGLERLQAVDAQLAQIVELKFFGGLAVDEIAAALGVSPRSVDRGWRLARAWWCREFGDDRQS